MKAKTKTIIPLLISMMLMLSFNSYGQIIYTTNFEVADSWSGGTMSGYNEKEYNHDGWHFHSTESVRGDAGESFGGSPYSFRDRDVFTVKNLEPVSNMAGFSFQLRDWMIGGEQRNVNISTNGGSTWETIAVINKDWFNDYQVYQEFVHMFDDVITSIAAEDLRIVIEGGGGTNDGRINIGQFVALGEATQVAAPTFSPPAGTYSEPIELTINTITSGASVYYTINGGEPTESDNLFVSPIIIEEDAIVKAKAYKDGLSPSATVSADYQFVNILLDKNFNDNELYSGDWSVYDVYAGANTWHISSFGGETFAQITEYQSTPEYPESYYISPSVDLQNNYTNIVLGFENTASYKEGNALSVKISTDFSGSGDPANATWTTLNAIYDDPDGTHGNWTYSGDISLDDYAGETVYIAFHYLSDANNLGRWRVNNVLVSSDYAPPISSDASLSVFNIGGVSALNLQNIIVDDPENEDGATMYVEDFTGFEGIAVIANHEEATFEVTLNGTIVSSGDLASQDINADDVIVVTVTAENEVTTRYYKVTTIIDDRELAFTTPLGGEEYETGDEILIEWTSQNVTMLNLHVYMVGLAEPVAVYESIVAADGQFTDNLPNGAHGEFYFRLYDASDNTFFAQSENVTFIDTQAPVALQLNPENNAENVSENTSLTIYFDEEISKGSGNITVYLQDDDSVIEAIDVTSTQVNIIEGYAAMINLSQPLDFQTTHYVIVDAGAFEDVASNPFAGILANNEWVFTTAEEDFLICNGDFEYWTNDVPDCWFGSKTHTEGLEVNQYSANAQSGNYAVQLINDEGAHRRFSSQTADVENGKTYRINFWIRGHGAIRAALFDDRDFDFGYTYNSYININSAEWTNHTQYVTAAKTTNIAEFIFSVLDTNADLDHIQIDNVTIEEFEFSGDVATIAELRNGIPGGEYTFTGEAVLTFQQGYRNQKFIQDATGAILIDDPTPSVVATQYSIGDGISNIKGVLAAYGGMLQFQPTEDPGPATSIGNPIVPEEKTLADITSNDQAKLILVNNVEFATTGNFAVGIVYDISDQGNPTEDAVFRTNFYDADYIGSPIPTQTINLIALVTEHFGTYQLTARDSDDMKVADENFIADLDNEIIAIYPNPFSDNVSIIVSENVKDIVIMNNIGQSIMKLQSSSHNIQINTSDFNSGIYFVRFVMNDGSHITKKLIKQ